MPDSLQTAQVWAYVAGLVALLAWETARPFRDLFRRSWRARGRHLGRNLALAALNSAVLALGFVGLWVAAAAWSEAQGFGLLHRAGLPGVARTVAAVLLLDAWTYAWHRLNHRVPFLWRFHRVHHADRQMDVTTAGRFHVGEIVLSSALRLPLIALLGLRAGELFLYETMMFAVVQMHHANIGLPPAVDRALRAVFVSPAMHQVHHSRLRVETDSNYSAFLSVWDRLFGTFRLRPDPRDIVFGLDEDDEAAETFAGLLKRPLAPLPPAQDAPPAKDAQRGA